MMKVRYGVLGTIAAVGMLFLKHNGLSAPAIAKNHAVLDFKTGYLIGTSRAGSELKSLTEPSLKSAAKQGLGAQKYRVYAWDRALGEVSGTRPVSVDAPCPETLQVNLTPSAENKQFKSGVIAIAGSWNALPRVPRWDKGRPNAYKQDVAGILRCAGIAKPQINITQVLRCDLEGDGVDEVIISATRHLGYPNQPNSVSSNARKGEYSLILMRKIVRGKVETVLLEGEAYAKNKEFSAPSVYEIAGVFDVNGDGKMEIVTTGRYYEGNWMSVYGVNGAKVKNIASAGCGA